MRRWTLFILLALGAGFLVGLPERTVSADRAAPPATGAASATAVFAGGCFWCMEKPFDELVGVTQTLSGYSGGQKLNPTYEQVSAGTMSIRLMRAESSVTVARNTARPSLSRTPASDRPRKLPKRRSSSALAARSRRRYSRTPSSTRPRITTRTTTRRTRCGIVTTVVVAAATIGLKLFGAMRRAASKSWPPATNID